MIINRHPKQRYISTWTYPVDRMDVVRLSAQRNLQLHLRGLSFLPSYAAEFSDHV